MFFRRCAVVLAAALALSACSGISSPTKDNRDEDFTSTIDVGGAAAHTFDVSKNGEFAIRLLSLSPVANIIMGVTLGQMVSGSCSFSPVPNLMTINSLPYSGPINKGTYCVVVSDAGSLHAPETYTIRVSHP
jgi:hypothetical protein